VLGELMAGILLGPPLLGWLGGGPALAVLAEVGILLMMVYIGMEIDPRELGRASRAGLLAAIGGFITPFVLCYLAIVWTGGTQMAGIFVGIAAGVTSLATKSRILVDLRLLDTRIAHVMMAGALIADTLALVLFAAVIGLGESQQFDAAGLALIVGKAMLFFGVTTLLGLKVFPLIGRRLRNIKGFERTAFFTLVLLVALVYAELAELAGMHGILGAFLAGLFLREGVLGRSISKDVMGAVRDASIGFLAPIFFVTAGFSVSLDVFLIDPGTLALIVGLATIGKIAGTALFYLPTGNGWREGLTVGAGMNGRGAVEIIVAQIGLSMGLIDQNIFSILVFMAIFTTATVPVFLKWGAAWLRKRGELVRSDEERDGVLIVGAGPTARTLARLLAQTQPVWLIDSNKEHCAFAASEGLHTLEGSALNEQVLSDARASTQGETRALAGAVLERAPDRVRERVGVDGNRRADRGNAEFGGQSLNLGAARDADGHRPGQHRLNREVIALAERHAGEAE
jgi:Kef-type K+ transport system membrane component KefB